MSDMKKSIWFDYIKDVYKLDDSENLDFFPFDLKSLNFFYSWLLPDDIKMKLKDCFISYFDLKEYPKLPITEGFIYFTPRETFWEVDRTF